MGHPEQHLTTQGDVCHQSDLPVDSQVSLRVNAIYRPQMVNQVSAAPCRYRRTYRGPGNGHHNQVTLSSNATQELAVQFIVLELLKVTHTYGHDTDSHTVLDDVNLVVAKGELVSIVGTSGCGKSTLLRVVAGLLRPAIRRGSAGRHPRRGSPRRPRGGLPGLQPFAAPVAVGAGQHRAPAPQTRQVQGRTTRAAAIRRWRRSAWPTRVEIPVAAVRRHAAAGRHRPGAGLPAGAAADGRAVRLGRRADP